MLQRLKDGINDKPSSIKEIIVSEGVDFNSEAYIYEYTNIKNNKKYVGWHADSEKTYWHSSENEEFKKIFAGNEPILLLKILESGSKSWMTWREHEILKNADNGIGAKKSNKWYNGSNGTPREHPIRFDKIKSLGDKILSKYFDTGLKITKEELKDTDWFQSRHVLIKPDHKNTLKESMDLNPNLDDWNPVVLLGDYYGIGKNRGIGGTHTSSAFLSSKHAVEIGIQIVPKSEYDDFSEDEIRWLGNYLNKIERKPTEEVEVNDIVFTIYESQKKNNIKTWWNDRTKKMIDDMGFPPKSKEKIRKEVQKLLDEDELRKRPTQQFKIFSKEEKEQIVKEIQNEYPNSLVISYSSKKLELSRPLRKCRENNTKEVVLVMFHNTVLSYEDWDTQKIEIKKDNEFGPNLLITWKEIEPWVSNNEMKI